MNTLTQLIAEPRQPINKFVILEPISKVFQEHRDAGELDEPEEIGGIVLPANKEPPLPLELGKEAFDEPAPFIPA